jgi:hypothetical protein
MGWVKKAKTKSFEIFSEVIKTIPTWKGIPDDSSTPYEYFVDYLRDNFELTTDQMDEIALMLRGYYQIEKFYHE